MSRVLVTAFVVLLSIVSSSVALAGPNGPRAKAPAATKTTPAKRAPAAPVMVAVATPVPAPAPPPAAIAPAPLPAVTTVPPPPSPVFSSTPIDQPESAPEGAVQKRVAITLNPMPMAIGRFGGNVEVLAAPHHAFIGSFFVQSYPTGILQMLMPSVKLGEGPKPLVGGEVGYRYYTGRASPSGLFVGPSFVAMPFAYPRVNENLDAELVAFHAYGAALDFGAQLVTSGGFTFGGGLGVMALAYTPPASVAPPAGVQVPSYPEPHVLPRLLVSAGWAF